MTYLLRGIVVCAVISVLSFGAQPTAAQVVNNWAAVGSGDWNTAANWNGLFGPAVPDISESDRAAINNGGQATLAASAAGTPGGIFLGQANGQSGTLVIQSGGSLIVVREPSLDQTDGAVRVGQATTGLGTLSIDRGGSLTAESIIVGGDAASSVTFGSVGGSGSATINVQTANFLRQTRVIGPNVNFTAADTIALAPTSELVAQITDPSSHSALKASVVAVLDGTLTPEFGAGIMPTIGNAWNLFDARNVSGEFDAIDTSMAPDLGLGQVYAVRSQSGGANGTLVQLAVEQRLVINVDRSSGAVSIANPGSSSIALDGYSIGSATFGALNQASWSPIGGAWEVANASANQLNELNRSGSLNLAASGSQSLGAIFAPPTPAEFGVPTEDLTFSYTQPDGTTHAGVVNYTGTAGINNLTLIVDPLSGAAQLRNTSDFTVAIDAYTISSTFGSLETAGWSSLDDQNAAGGDWQEGNIDANRLSELKLGGETTLGTGSSFDLGNLFNESGGKKDLVLEFLLEGELASRTGVVVYGPIPAPGVPGDYNNNGTVDAADYTVWRDNFGTTNTLPNDEIGGTINEAHYSQWKDNFGASAGGGSVLGGAAAVPEPSSLVLLLASLATGAVMLRNRSAKSA